MRVLVAPASFKGTLSAAEAADAIAAGVRRARPDADVIVRPVADGGEGTLDVLGLPTRAIRVQDAWGASKVVHVGEDRVGGAGTGLVIELARICGFDPARRDVMTASTRGVGEALRAGLDATCGRYLVCLGGSATCDGGTGLLRALGAGFWDAHGNVLPEGPAALVDLARFQPPRLPIVELTVACDVDAPLVGEAGAARRFGPQKGASPADVERLERGLQRFADVIEDLSGLRLHDLPGAGAAGGTGAALALLGGRLRPGADLVLDRLGFDALLAGVDLVITGEGRVDAGSLQGKAPATVARRAARRGVPVAIVAGGIDVEVPGVTAVWAVGAGEREGAAERLAARVAAGMAGR
ncbi:MAG: glycerate kinase [Pseudomonadota bacterium]|nr:glycerate kinase [Pseudomonadota bacterium]